MISIRVWTGIGALAVAGAAFGQQGFDAAQFQKQMEAMQKALQANAAAAQPVVDFRQLKALLPETIGDMKRTNAKGEKSGAMGMTVAKAEGTYEGAKEARLKVEITDMSGVGAMGALAQFGFAATEIDNESDDGYERTVKIKNFKALEKYDTKAKSGSLQVIVGRFSVQIEGDNIAPAILKTAAEAIDLQALSALKAAAK
ncbi:MAG: hypothetical protein KJ579_02380 [Verrucomicrobia bacterium]|nr:hypothetical protein [Verrucomicrobiota bacterium]